MLSYRQCWAQLWVHRCQPQREASGDRPPHFHPLAQLPEATTCQAGPLIVTPPSLLSAVYFRALVNFTRSIDYSPQLEDAGSEEFREVSEAVVDTVR